MVKPKRKLTIVLTSGLGNQIYGFFAGQYFSEKLMTKVEYIHNPLPLSHPQYNSNIRSFIISESVNRSKTDIFIPKIFFRIGAGLRRRSRILLTADTYIGRKYFEKMFNFERETKELDTGLNKSLTKKRTVVGYFQDFSYFINLEKKIKLEIETPSNWYVLQKVAVESIRPIIVHCRLGDYIDNPNIWGILDSAYYEKALNEVLVEFPEKEIWVFSDNFLIAKVLLKDLNKFNLKFIDSSINQDPAEVLMVMSEGIGHIVSNSTFSLWSAMLSASSRIVVVPDPVFRNVKGQARGLPVFWKRQSAIWASEEKIYFLKSKATRNDHPY